MPTRLITPPAAEPLSLAAAKAHLRLEHELDNDFVTSSITAARTWAEEHLWRGLVTQTWELVEPAFPSEWAELPFGHLSSITHVKYLDADGVEQTLAVTEYEADTTHVPGRLRLAYDKAWPATRSTWNAVVVRYVVGWASGSVPEPIVHALKLLVSHLYEQRAPEVTGTIVTPVRFAMESLLAPYRLARF